LDSPFSALPMTMSASGDLVRGGPRNDKVGWLQVYAVAARQFAAICDCLEEVRHYAPSCHDASLRLSIH